MKRIKEDVVPGKWFAWESPIAMVCCDCGLVERWETKRVKGKLYMRIYRDNRSTTPTRKYEDFPMKAKP